MTKQRVKNKYKGFYAEFIKHRGSTHGVFRLVKGIIKKNRRDTCRMLQELYIENWKTQNIKHYGEHKIKVTAGN